MSRVPLYWVDAFADAVGQGNPAAVNGLSETAFLLTDRDPTPLRWFTPTEEVERLRPARHPGRRGPRAPDRPFGVPPHRRHLLSSSRLTTPGRRPGLSGLLLMLSADLLLHPEGCVPCCPRVLSG